MAVSFVRQLGSQPGVQLNPLVDDSEIPTTGNEDQKFGIIMRATRGRIDKPFAVNQGNVYKKLGRGEPISKSTLNLAWVHVVEALNNGAYEVIVSRLITKNAVNKYLVVKHETKTVKVIDTPASEGVTEVSHNETQYTGGFTSSTSETVPTEYFFYLKHLSCHNDGIRVKFRVEENKSGGVEQNSSVMTIKLIDADDNELFEFTGSLDPEAVDDYGNSYYLPNIISSQTELVELHVNSKVTYLSPGCDAYGYDSNGSQKWADSGLVICFTEGGTEYETEDYVKARQRLQYTDFDFAYISSGGTESPALLAQLATLAFDTNRQLRFDIPGNLSVEAAIAFVEQLNMGSNKCAHLMQAFWCPLKSADPTGVNPIGYFGAATLNIAYACGRNANTNSKGFAPKNYPIAGREWPIGRTNILQTTHPTEQDLDALARAKINPCIFETYTGGGRYVFLDSLTCAEVESSLRKLISVADMSTSIDEAVTKAGKGMLQLPMDLAVKRMAAYLEDLFVGAQSAGWLVPSSDPMMGGMAYKYEVKPNEARPYDRMDVNYWLRYDGCARQIFVTQTLKK